MSSKYLRQLISAFLVIIISIISFSACGGNSGNTGANGGNNADNGSGGNSDNSDGSSDSSTQKKGNKVGDLCYGLDLERVGGGDSVNIEDFRGKIVVINFWGTWCGFCIDELPHFDEVATEYGDSTVILAIHSVASQSEAPEYINKHLPNSDMIFLYDEPLTSTKDKYYTLIGGSQGYPYTVIIDKEGIISYQKSGYMSKSELVSAIENALK